MPAKKFKVTQKTHLPALKVTYDERAIYDWLDIRTDYIEGIQDKDGTYIWPSIKYLSEKYNVPEKSLANRATKERWREYQTAHKNKLALERQKEHARILAGKSVKFDEQTVDLAEEGLTLIFDRFEELKKLQPQIEANRQAIIQAAEEDGKPFRVSDVKASAFSGSELESLSKAAALFVEIGRKGLGLKDGETSITNNTNIEVTQTNIAEELRRPDKDRIAEFARILSNKNISLPALTQEPEPFDIEVIDE